MSEPKPFASLGPTLLARKGGARPAMRPQLGSMAPGALSPAAPSPSEADLDDLGWNDMGEDTRHEHKLADVLPLTPASAKPETRLQPRAEPALSRPQTHKLPPLKPAAQQMAAAPEPEVKRQQRQIVDALEDTEPTSPAAPRRAATDQGRRAAFTLRLDAKRHLKLRLASTIKNRSAQQLVTMALDKYLMEMPEIATLADRVRRDENRS